MAGTTSGSPARPRPVHRRRAGRRTEPALERTPIFAFEATNTDAFFRNGVKLGDEVLTVFEEGFYDRLVTVPTKVPVEEIAKGQPLTVSVWAGTKAFPVVSTDDNNDDFSIRNLRLALPDGRVLRPTLVGVHASNGTTAVAGPGPADGGPTNSDATRQRLRRGDLRRPGQRVRLAGTRLGHHHRRRRSTHGQGPPARSPSPSPPVQVDNNEPSVTAAMGDARLRGPFTVDADATDAGSGVASLSTTLDGADVTLPHPTSSLELMPGATRGLADRSDEIGNTTPAPSRSPP